MNVEELKNKVQSKIQDFDEETMTYVQMLLITYVITIGIVFVFLCLLFDKTELTEFQFSRCEKVDPFLYSVSCVIQTLVPTTITFSGTIIILQSKLNSGKTMKVLLFISIILLALIGVLQTSVQTSELLYISNFILLFLNFVSLFLSRKVFYLPVESSKGSKCETSDCKPIS